MALISGRVVFSVGGTIYAADHNYNDGTIWNDYNGNITNANISASAAISDTKLAQITTSAKVSGAALTSLSSIPSGSGAVPTKNGGTAADFSATAQGSTLYFSAAGVISALAVGTSGQFLKTQGAGANPIWATIFSASVLDYGTSASSSTERGISGSTLKIAFGSLTISGSSNSSLSNLPFSSSSSFIILGTFGTATDATEALVITRGSGSAATIYNNDNNSQAIMWLAIGT